MRIFSVVAVLLVMAISTMLQLVITLAQAELARTLNEGVGNANDSSAKQLADAIAQSASLAAAVSALAPTLTLTLALTLNISNWVLKHSPEA